MQRPTINETNGGDCFAMKSFCLSRSVGRKFWLLRFVCRLWRPLAARFAMRIASFQAVFTAALAPASFAIDSSHSVPGGAGSPGMTIVVAVGTRRTISGRISSRTGDGLSWARLMS